MNVYINILQINAMCRSINYGSIGFTISHEMMHAIDKYGRVYNKKGLFVKRGYGWTKESIEQYDLRADLIRKQFSQYSINENKVSNTFNNHIHIYIYIYIYMNMVIERDSKRY